MQVQHTYLCSHASACKCMHVVEYLKVKSFTTSVNIKTLTSSSVTYYVVSYVPSTRLSLHALFNAHLTVNTNNSISMTVKFFLQ